MKSLASHYITLHFLFHKIILQLKILECIFLWMISLAITHLVTGHVAGISWVRSRFVFCLFSRTFHLNQKYLSLVLTSWIHHTLPGLRDLLILICIHLNPSHGLDTEWYWLLMNPPGQIFRIHNHMITYSESSGLWFTWVDNHLSPRFKHHFGSFGQPAQCSFFKFIWMHTNNLGS